MKKTLVLLTGLVLMASANAAGNADAGKAKATTICAACHGPKGISILPIYPNLAGQKADYLVKQLKAFKDKTRIDPTMQPMSAPLTDDDIANLAAYFSSLPAGG